MDFTPRFSTLQTPRGSCDPSGRRRSDPCVFDLSGPSPRQMGKLATKTNCNEFKDTVMSSSLFEDRNRCLHLIHDLETKRANSKGDILEVFDETEELLERALEMGCSRTVPYAMDVFENSIAMVDRLADLLAHGEEEKHICHRFKGSDTKESLETLATTVGEDDDARSDASGLTLTTEDEDDACEASKQEYPEPTKKQDGPEDKNGEARSDASGLSCITGDDDNEASIQEDPKPAENQEPVAQRPCHTSIPLLNLTDLKKPAAQNLSRPSIPLLDLSEARGPKALPSINPAAGFAGPSLSPVPTGYPNRALPRPCFQPDPSAPKRVVYVKVINSSVASFAEEPKASVVPTPRIRVVKPSAPSLMSDVVFEERVTSI